VDRARGWKKATTKRAGANDEGCALADERIAGRRGFEETYGCVAGPMARGTKVAVIW